MFTACSYVYYQIPGEMDKAVPISEYLSYYKATEDHHFTEFTGTFDDKWQVDDEGKEYLLIRSDKGYCTQYRDGSFATHVDGKCYKCGQDRAMELLEPDWYSMCADYGESVLTTDELDALFEKVELNADNYLDYIGFEQVDTANEITGFNAEYRKRYRPYEYMINTYVGSGTILPEYCEKISVKGTVTRQVRIKVYDLKYNLFNSYIEDETSGNNIPFDISYNASYLGDVDSYCIHFTPYMDPLESWYLKTYSNGLQEIHQTLIDISDIKITEAAGTLAIFKEPTADMWSTGPDGRRYIAIKEADGGIERYYSTEELIENYFN